MPVSYKENYLRDIAALVRKGAVYFEAQDRPELDMGGRKVYVSGVSYDHDCGILSFSVENAEGKALLSAGGARPLSMLDAKTLRVIGGQVRVYADMKRERAMDIVNIEAAVCRVGPARSSGVSL